MKITELITKLEKCGNGEVIVARWKCNGEPRHMSTLKGSSTVTAYHKEIEASLSEKSGLMLWNFGK